ncbi:MAG TPA: class I SAM-dependent methyltransferase [Caulobacter sp.]|nr:class I SAM-dependent methyltransferase [Caulobacter sp.]
MTDIVAASIADMSLAGSAWDRAWAETFAGALDDPLRPAAEWVRAPLKGLRKASSEELYATALAIHAPTKGATPCGLFLPGSSIVGRRVVELGCGYGWLGRQIAPWTSRYLGVDISRLSLCVARSARGPRMRYAHIADQAVFRDLRGTFDTLFTRNTFFHLNRAHAVGALLRGRELLRPGSLAVVDFCTIRPGSIAGTIHDHDAPFDHLAPTCGYSFTESQIAAVARDAAFDVEEIKPDSTGTHCYVRLRMR